MITARDILILLALWTYYVLNRPMIQRLVFPNDPNGRICRRRLQSLSADGLIVRLRTLVCHPGASPGPVYHLARKGCELLAEQFESEEYLVANTASPSAHLIYHWLAIGNTHVTFDQAVAAQQDVTIKRWVNESEVVKKDESAPEKRFFLYTLLRDTPRLVCAPDAGFLLSAYDYSKIFYLEQDRATSGVRQVATSKTPGYAALAERNLQQRHFQANVPGFSVLLIAPTERRRDALRRAIAEKSGAHLWKFATEGDVTPEKVLHEPIWYVCGNDEPAPLVKRRATT